LTSVWAVWRRSNPHIPSSGEKTLIVLYDNRDDALNFVAIHPQYHYEMGVASPRQILEIQEIQLGEVWAWWQPSFP
jgi:hypothetical protein